MQLDIFKANSYHNSMSIRDKKVLDFFEGKAQGLEAKVLKFFQDHKYESFTPAQIHIVFGQQYPITSVRRAISNLTDRFDKLEMTDETRPGLYGRENKCWKLKS